MDRYNPSPLPLYGNPTPAPQRPAPKGLGLSSQFQIGTKEVIASFFWWIFMFWLAFKGFQYGALYMTFDDSKLDSPECCKNFGGNIQDNRNFIEGKNSRTSLR